MKIKCNAQPRLLLNDCNCVQLMHGLLNLNGLKTFCAKTLIVPLSLSYHRIRFRCFFLIYLDRELFLKIKTVYGPKHNSNYCKILLRIMTRYQYKMLHFFQRIFMIILTKIYKILVSFYFLKDISVLSIFIMFKYYHTRTWYFTTLDFPRKITLELQDFTGSVKFIFDPKFKFKTTFLRLNVQSRITLKLKKILPIQKMEHNCHENGILQGYLAKIFHSLSK